MEELEGGTPRPVVVLHERSGAWARQLRSRLGDLRARWVETRSTGDLLAAVSELAAPVALIEAGADAVPALRDLARLTEAASAPRVLFLDPLDRPEALRLARELGATRAESGALPPLEVAVLIRRWIGLSARAMEREGWSRSLPADPTREPDEWIDEVVAEAAGGSRFWSREAASATMGERCEPDRKAPSLEDAAERGGSRKSADGE